jgi:hypothetical protein
MNMVAQLLVHRKGIGQLALGLDLFLAMFSKHGAIRQARSTASKQSQLLLDSLILPHVEQ